MDTLELVKEDIQEEVKTPRISHLSCAVCHPAIAACGTARKAEAWSPEDKKNAIRCVVCLDLDEYYTQNHILPCLRKHRI